MGGRVVEGTGLENRQARKRLGGSNPSPSASNGYKCLICRFDGWGGGCAHLPGSGVPDRHSTLWGSSVLGDQTVRPGEYVARDFQTGLVRRKYSGAPNFTERGAVEGVQADGGVAFVVRED
jgi:hypothetical protein